MASTIRGQLKIEIRNLQKITKDIENLKTGSERVVKDTLNDIRSRAPSWVASAVVKTYNFDKKEIVPGSKRAGAEVKQAGSFKVRGERIDDMVLVYSGRLLTPTHFKMKPSKPLGLQKTATRIPGKAIKKKRAGASTNVAMIRQPLPYTITQEVYKGSRKELENKHGTPPFLAKNKSGQYIPFQRKGKARDEVDSIKTTSVPSMVTNEVVKEDYMGTINTELEKRFKHHAKRHLGITPK